MLCMLHNLCGQNPGTFCHSSVHRKLPQRSMQHSTKSKAEQESTQQDTFLQDNSTAQRGTAQHKSKAEQENAQQDTFQQNNNIAQHSTAQHTQHGIPTGMEGAKQVYSRAACILAIALSMCPACISKRQPSTKNPTSASWVSAMMCGGAPSRLRRMLSCFKACILHAVTTSNLTTAVEPNSLWGLLVAHQVGHQAYQKHVQKKAGKSYICCQHGENAT